MHFVYFFLRKLERRFDLLFCTGSANRNSGTANECVLTIGRKLFFFYFLTFRATLCGRGAIDDVTSFYTKHAGENPEKKCRWRDLVFTTTYVQAQAGRYSRGVLFQEHAPGSISTSSAHWGTWCMSRIKSDKSHWPRIRNEYSHMRQKLDFSRGRNWR